MLQGYFSNAVAATFFLIFVYIVATNYNGFSQLFKSGGPQVIGFVKALQGR